MDRIIVMNDGCIVEEGRFDKLMRSKGLFYDFHEQQKLKDDLNNPFSTLNYTHIFNLMLILLHLPESIWQLNNKILEQDNRVERAIYSMKLK